MLGQPTISSVTTKNCANKRQPGEFGPSFREPPKFNVFYFALHAKNLRESLFVATLEDASKIQNLAPPQSLILNIIYPRIRNVCTDLKFKTSISQTPAQPFVLKIKPPFHFELQENEMVNQLQE